MRVVNVRVGRNFSSKEKIETLKYGKGKRCWWRRIFMPLSKESKKDTTSVLDTISIDEWILILLYAQKDKPLTGKLMFVKQAFLLANDVFPSIKEKFKFYPSSFGPYSKDFARSVNSLAKDGYIIIEVKEEEENVIFRFKLSQNGIVNAERAFDKLSDDEKKIIQNKRKGWDQLGYTGIVHLVYTKYPEYAIYSKIKEKIE